MIERVWRGWIAPGKADEYQRFLRVEFLPAAHSIPGYLGARVLRRSVGDEIEFMTITRFDSIEAIREFAGEDLERAHVAAPAQALLGRWDDRVAHYDIAFDDQVRDGTAASRPPSGIGSDVSDRKSISLRTARSGALAVGTGAVGSLAVGSLAVGALAVGALAIGALAVGRLSIGKARIRRLEIDELTVGTLTGPGSAPGPDAG